MNTILFSFSISLFDSISTTQQIIIFVLLLTTVNPLRNALSYFAGLSLSYFLCGVIGYYTLDRLLVLVNQFFPDIHNLSDPGYYQTEFLTGIIMLILGIWYYRAKRNAKPHKNQNLLLAKLQSMNALFALGIGVIISVSSFPCSIPYFVALSKYTTLHMQTPAVIGSIFLYNVGYALPMVIILLIYLFLRKRSNITGSLQEKARILNVQLTTWALVGVGLFSMIDAGCYFSIGHALVKGRYF